MIARVRCLGGRLGDAYPAAEHDIELQVTNVAAADLATALREEAERALADDPRCRKVVFAAPAGDRETIDAAEAAGCRYVVDVDVLARSGSADELSLMVREHADVTAVDMDLDIVPGS